MNKEKYQIKLVRTVNNVFDPWELSKFINDFGNEYYKFDLIRNICIELKNGTPPENIIILNNPIKRKYINYEHFDLNDPSKLYSFQSIGQPIGLYPNKKVLEIALFIRIYKKFNRILNRNISKNVFSKEFQNLQNFSFEVAISNLQDEALKKLGKNVSQGVKNNISEAKNEIANEYKLFCDREENINSLIKHFKENDENEAEIAEEYASYFNDFFIHFKKTSKPLIGIYIKEEQKIKIVCGNHLKKRRKGELPELDFQKYSHNSPPLFDIATDVTSIGKTIYDAKKEQEVRDEIIKTEKLKQSLLERQIQVEDAKIENLKLNKQILEAKLHSITNGSNERESLQNNVENIPNNQIRIQMIQAYTNQIQDTTLVLKRNQLVIREEPKEWII